MNDLIRWVEEAKGKEQQKFRNVVHIILHAIASNHELKTALVMKGGILAAILYHTGRFTKDIDFSTEVHYSDFRGQKDDFLDTLSKAIIQSSAELPYGIACQIQTHEVRPGEDGNFQTLHIKVGYAIKTNLNAMSRLRAGQSPSVVEIDYSFNELIEDTSTITICEREELQAYGLLTLVAEKLRAVLQQADVEGGRARGSSRGQDIFDLDVIFSRLPFDSVQQKEVLSLLIKKADSRGLKVDRSLIRRQEIYDKCEERYKHLKDEVEDELPEFSEAFERIAVFYEKLPW